MTKATKRLFRLSANAVAEFIARNPWIWEQSVQRQNRVAPVSATKGALILYSEANALSYIPCLNKKMEALFDLIVPCLREAQKHYGRGYWCKATLTMLPAKGQVKPHFDKGWPLTHEHRIHWAIVTNPLVKFNIGHSEYHFEQDEIWEVDNRTEHSVINSGDTDRVHLIADFVPEPGEKMHYWQPYEKGSLEDLFFQAVDRARERWGSLNNPLY